jgi:hypothetical protein
VVDIAREAHEINETRAERSAGFLHLEPRMVKTKEKAARIQAKRAAAGKTGIAKAVRRFYRREGIGGA